VIYFLRNPLISVICDKEKTRRMAGLGKTTLIAKEKPLKKLSWIRVSDFWVMLCPRFPER
jgi:hypothetical protein